MELNDMMFIDRMSICDRIAANAVAQIKAGADEVEIDTPDYFGQFEMNYIMEKIHKELD